MMGQCALRYRRTWLVMGWGLIALLFYLSITPDPPLQLHIRWWDKLEHATTYGLLMGWFMQIYGESRARTLVALALMAFGILMEFLQALGPYRTFDVADMLANGTGLLMMRTLLPPQGAQLLCRLERSFVGA